MQGEIDAIVAEKPLVLLYVSTRDCNVCRDLRPKVKAMVEARDQWTWVFRDAEDNPELAGQLLVLAVPTIIVYVDGRESLRFSRHVGLGQLEEVLDRYQTMLAAME